MLRRLALLSVLVGLGMILWGETVLGSVLLPLGGAIILLASFRKADTGK